MEGGCYAKCIDLSALREPEIFSAIRFGAVLENVVVDPVTRLVDYSDDSLTENTRCAYPIDFIPRVQIPCIAGHPKNIVLLTCDAFGVLPPISSLSPAQTQYHFLSGYTAKIAGTEEGIKEPTETFSACFGEPFLVWHPTKYAAMLAERLQRHQANAWLLNTGWIGGKYTTSTTSAAIDGDSSGGHRISLKHTRAILDAIHAGTLKPPSAESQDYEVMPVFGLHIPRQVPGVPDEILHPQRAWAHAGAPPNAYHAELARLAALFCRNFVKYAEVAGPEIEAAGPACSPSPSA